jgi:hypothetical protein
MHAQWMRITRQTFDAMPTHSQVLVGDKSMGSMQPQLHRPRDREIGHVVSVCSGVHVDLRHRVTKAGSLSTPNITTPLLISFHQTLNLHSVFGLQVNAGVCIDANLTMPASTKACNTALCPAAILTWAVGPWSECMSR